jgi:CBS domain-containing protein
MPHGSWTDSEHDHTRDPHLVAPELVGHLMRADFPAVRPNTSVESGRMLMERHRLDLLPMVQSDGRLLGVLLRRDLDLAASRGPAAVAAVTVDTLARHDIPSAVYEESIADVVEEMTSHDVTALPVTSSSAQGQQVEGLVVLADLRSHERAVTRAPSRLAHARPSSRMLQAGVAALGTLQLVLWMFHPVLGGPPWRSWLELSVAILAFASAATWRTSEMIGPALSTFVSVALVVLVLFGQLLRVPPVVTWIHLALACGFLASTALVARESDRPRAAHIQPRRPSWMATRPLIP